jgi:hypothetical protein
MIMMCGMNLSHSVCVSEGGLWSTWEIGSLPFWCSCHGDSVHTFFYSELISKYNAKCKENETLQKQQKKYNPLENQRKLISAVTKQMLLEEVSNVYCERWIN